MLLEQTHEYAKRSIRYELRLTVNSTPIEILSKINIHSLRGFAGYIKHYYLNSYQAICTIPRCYICAE